jgi:hypothetical protein
MLKKLAKNTRFLINVGELNKGPKVPTLALPGHPDHFVQVSDRRCKLSAPQPVPVPPGQPPHPEGSVSRVESGNDQDPERNFLWLPFLPGKISYTRPVPGLPIITGLMSGCWLGTFTMNGQTYFCHIGTEDLPNSPNSLQAKNYWKIAVGRHQITPQSLFSPQGLGDKTFGALTTDNQFCTLACKAAPVGTANFGTICIVLAITRVAGQAKPVFKD